MTACHNYRVILCRQAADICQLSKFNLLYTLCLRENCCIRKLCPVIQHDAFKTEMAQKRHQLTRNMTCTENINRTIIIKLLSVISATVYIYQTSATCKRQVLFYLRQSISLTQWQQEPPGSTLFHGAKCSLCHSQRFFCCRQVTELHLTAAAAGHACCRRKVKRFYKAAATGVQVLLCQLQRIILHTAAADGSVQQALCSYQHAGAAGARSRAFAFNQNNKIARLRAQDLRAYFLH